MRCTLPIVLSIHGGKDGIFVFNEPGDPAAGVLAAGMLAAEG